jgi:hypothetical protein
MIRYIAQVTALLHKQNLHLLSQFFNLFHLVSSILLQLLLDLNNLGKDLIQTGPPARHTQG